MKEIYRRMEDAFYSLLDYLDSKGIPVYRAVDWMEERGIPPFPTITAAILLLLALLAFLLLPSTVPVKDVYVSVTDGVDPIEGAKVVARFSSGDYHCYTDDKGLCIIPEVPEDENIEVEVYAEGFKKKTVEVSGTSTTVVLEPLQEEKIESCVLIKDKTTGKILEPVEIRINGQVPAKVGNYYCANVPPGSTPSYVVQVYGYPPASGTFEAKYSRNNPYVIELQRKEETHPKYNVIVTVLSDKVPVKDVDVYVYEVGSEEAKERKITDNRGIATFELPGGTYIIKAKKGDATAEKLVMVQEDTEVNIEFGRVGKEKKKYTLTICLEGKYTAYINKEIIQGENCKDINLEEGNYNIKIEKDGVLIYETNITLTSNMKIDVPYAPGEKFVKFKGIYINNKPAATLSGDCDIVFIASGSGSIEITDIEHDEGKITLENTTCQFNTLPNEVKEIRFHLHVDVNKPAPVRIEYKANGEENYISLYMTPFQMLCPKGAAIYVQADSLKAGEEEEIKIYHASCEEQYDVGYIEINGEKEELTITSGEKYELLDTSITKFIPEDTTTKEVTIKAWLEKSGEEVAYFEKTVTVVGRTLFDLNICTNVEEFNVEVNGETHSSEGKCITLKLPQGEYDVNVWKEGYKNATTTVLLYKDENITITLVPEDYNGTILFFRGIEGRLATIPSGKTVNLLFEGTGKGTVKLEIKYADEEEYGSVLRLLTKEFRLTDKMKMYKVKVRAGQVSEPRQVVIGYEIIDNNDVIKTGEITLYVTHFVVSCPRGAGAYAEILSPFTDFLAVGKENTVRVYHVSCGKEYDQVTVQIGDTKDEFGATPEPFVLNYSDYTYTPSKEGKIRIRVFVKSEGRTVGRFSKMFNAGDYNTNICLEVSPTIWYAGERMILKARPKRCDGKKLSMFDPEKLKVYISGGSAVKVEPPVNLTWKGAYYAVALTPGSGDILLACSSEEYQCQLNPSVVWIYGKGGLKIIPKTILVPPGYSSNEVCIPVENTARDDVYISSVEFKCYPGEGSIIQAPGTVPAEDNSCVEVRVSSDARTCYLFIGGYYQREDGNYYVYDSETIPVENKGAGISIITEDTKAYTEMKNTIPVKLYPEPEGIIIKNVQINVESDLDIVVDTPLIEKLENNKTVYLEFVTSDEGEHWIKIIASGYIGIIPITAVREIEVNVGKIDDYIKVLKTPHVVKFPDGYVDVQDELEIENATKFPAEVELRLPDGLSGKTRFRLNGGERKSVKITGLKDLDEGDYEILVNLAFENTAKTIEIPFTVKKTPSNCIGILAPKFLAPGESATVSIINNCGVSVETKISLDDKEAQITLKPGEKHEEEVPAPEGEKEVKILVTGNHGIENYFIIKVSGEKASAPFEEGKISRCGGTSVDIKIPRIHDNDGSHSCETGFCGSGEFASFVADKIKAVLEYSAQDCSDLWCKAGSMSFTFYTKDVRNVRDVISDALENEGLSMWNMLDECHNGALVLEGESDLGCGKHKITLTKYVKKEFGELTDKVCVKIKIENVEDSDVEAMCESENPLHAALHLSLCEFKDEKCERKAFMGEECTGVYVEGFSKEMIKKVCSDKCMLQESTTNSANHIIAVNKDKSGCESDDIAVVIYNKSDKKLTIKVCDDQVTEQNVCKIISALLWPQGYQLKWCLDGENKLHIKEVKEIQKGAAAPAGLGGEVIYVIPYVPFSLSASLPANEDESGCLKYIDGKYIFECDSNHEYTDTLSGTRYNIVPVTFKTQELLNTIIKTLDKNPENKKEELYNALYATYKNKLQVDYSEVKMPEEKILIYLSDESRCTKLNKYENVDEVSKKIFKNVIVKINGKECDNVSSRAAEDMCMKKVLAPSVTKALSYITACAGIQWLFGRSGIGLANCSISYGMYTLMYNMLEGHPKYATLGITTLGPGLTTLGIWGLADLIRGKTGTNAATSKVIQNKHEKIVEDFSNKLEKLVQQNGTDTAKKLFNAEKFKKFLQGKIEKDGVDNLKNEDALKKYLKDFLQEEYKNEKGNLRGYNKLQESLERRIFRSSEWKKITDDIAKSVKNAVKLGRLQRIKETIKNIKNIRKGSRGKILTSAALGGLVGTAAAYGIAYLTTQKPGEFTIEIEGGDGLKEITISDKGIIIKDFKEQKGQS